MVAFNPARRALFRGRSACESAAVRPPWSKESLLQACTRCDACIHACETGILIRGDGGYPEVDFSRGGCTFCGACREACEHDVFAIGDGKAWSLVATLNDSCLSTQGIVCRACDDACDYRALSFRLQTGGRALPMIDHAVCRGCGACVAVCPDSAIRMGEAA